MAPFLLGLTDLKPIKPQELEPFQFQLTMAHCHGTFFVAPDKAFQQILGRRFGKFFHPQIFNDQKVGFYELFNHFLPVPRASASLKSPARSKALSSATQFIFNEKLQGPVAPVSAAYAPY